MRIRDAAVILLFNDKKEVLLQHRTEDAQTYPGCWAFFGGGIKENETPIEALKRETFEELHYELKNPVEIMTQKFSDEYQTGIKHVYMEKFDSSQKLVLGEGQDMKWLDPASARALKMNSHDKEVLEYLQGKY